MSKSFAKAFYGSIAWQKTRKAYIKSVHCVCEICRAPCGFSGIVHHKRHLDTENINNPEITLNWENLMYLCKKCHNETHSDSLPVRDDFKFDDEGNLVRR
jgi:5-methylcytosine-specific restriction endonuclease McrA